VIFAFATVTGAAALMPWLKIGSPPSALSGLLRAPESTIATALGGVKIALLESNLARLLLMRIFFTIQAVMTLIAVGLALAYSAWR
jgi:hypothetical protein